MNARSVFLVMVLGLILPMRCLATNIDVMIVFSDDSGLSTFEKTEVAARFQLRLSAVYGGEVAGVHYPSQLDGEYHTITVWPLLAPEMSYSNAEEKTTGEALLWMKDKNADVTSSLWFARETLGNPGADLVIMVVPELDGVCGAAGYGLQPNTVNLGNSETRAFAVVALEENMTNCPEEYVVPHEIGHLLYAEHEVDLNGNPSLPSPINHATENLSLGIETLMYGNAHNSKSSNFLSGYTSQITAPDADNVQFFSRSSFNIVAGYRGEPHLYKGYYSTGCFDQFTFFWNLHNLRLSGATFYIVIGGNDTCVSVGLPREWEVVW